MNQHKSTYRRGEHGSLATFLIVGAVLLAIMAGVAYAVTQRSDTQVTDRSNDVAQQEEQERDEVTEEEPQEGAKEEDAAPRDEEAPVEEDQATTEEDVEQPPAEDEEQDEDREVAEAPVAGPSGELPQAGIGEVVLTIAGFAVLAYALYRYVQSRLYTPISTK